MDYQRDTDRVVGENVRRCREALGRSQAQLAQELRAFGYAFQQQAILKIERGSRPLRLAEAMAFAQCLRVPVEMLSYEHSDESLGDIRGRFAAELLDINRQAREKEREIEAAHEHLAVLTGDLAELRRRGVDLSESLIEMDKTARKSRSHEESEQS